MDLDGKRTNFERTPASLKRFYSSIACDSADSCASNAALIWRSTTAVIGKGAPASCIDVLPAIDFVFQNHDRVKDCFTDPHADADIGATALDRAPKLS